MIPPLPQHLIRRGRDAAHYSRETVELELVMVYRAVLGKRRHQIFQGPLCPLSNLFDGAPLSFRGRWYTSSEQSYQCAMAVHHGNERLASAIVKATT